MTKLIKLSPLLLSINACNETTNDSENFIGCYESDQVCYEDGLDATFYNKDEVLEFCDAIADINEEIKKDIYLGCVIVDNHNDDQECPNNVILSGFQCDSINLEANLERVFSSDGTKPNEEFCVLSTIPEVTCVDKY